MGPWETFFGPWETILGLQMPHYLTSKHSKLYITLFVKQKLNVLLEFKVLLHVKESQSANYGQKWPKMTKKRQKWPSKNGPYLRVGFCLLWLLNVSQDVSQNPQNSASRKNPIKPMSRGRFAS